MKCLQADPSTGPSSSKLVRDLSRSALLVKCLVTMPKFPTDVQPVIKAVPGTGSTQNLGKRIKWAPASIN